MQLNPDCIRDILLAVEKTTDFDSSFIYYNTDDIYSEGGTNCEILSKYSTKDVLYHIRQCELSELIIGVKRYNGYNYKIKDLSPKGHQFLADIRSDNIWNNTKSIATKVGSVSLDALIKISTGVLTQMINKQLGY